MRTWVSCKKPLSTVLNENCAQDRHRPPQASGPAQPVPPCEMPASSQMRVDPGRRAQPGTLGPMSPTVTPGKGRWVSSELRHPRAPSPTTTTTTTPVRCEQGRMPTQPPRGAAASDCCALPDLDHERMDAVVLVVDDEARPNDCVRRQLALPAPRARRCTSVMARSERLSGRGCGGRGRGREGRRDQVGVRTSAPIHHLVASTVGVCRSNVSSCGRYVAVVCSARTLEPCTAPAPSVLRCRARRAHL